MSVLGKCFTCAKVIEDGAKYCIEHMKCVVCSNEYFYNKYWPNKDYTKGLHFCMKCNYSIRIRKIWPKRFKIVNEGGSNVLDIKVRLTEKLVTMSQGGTGGDIICMNWEEFDRIYKERPNNNV